MSDSIECVVDCRNRLGEVPVWDVAEQALYWVDIEGKLLQRYTPATQAVERWQMPERISSFALREEGGLIVAFASGIALYDPSPAASNGSRGRTRIRATASTRANATVAAGSGPAPWTIV